MGNEIVQIDSNLLMLGWMGQLWIHLERFLVQLALQRKLQLEAP